MGKNWGRTPVTNADKRHLTQTKYLVEDADGGTEERIDRRPLGKVERFVDVAGGVVSLQLYADGDPKRHETSIRMRAAYHGKGFVEYAKCPIKHGTRNSSPVATKDFTKIEKSDKSYSPVECKQDPKVMSRRDGDLYAGESCPHIEALIRFRRAKAEDEFEKRNAVAMKRDEEKRELERAQAELIREQLAERKARKPKAKDVVE